MQKHTVSDFDLTVSIVNWNSGEILTNCLEALFRTIKRHSFQIFVADNNSDDNSMNALVQMFSNVRTIRNPYNKGLARANNQVLSQANSRYVLILNPDAIVTENTIDDMIDYLDNHPGYGLAACKVLGQDGSVIRTVIPIPSLSGELRISIKIFFYPFNKLIKNLPNGQSQDSAVKPLEVEAIGGPFLLANMKMIQDIGLMEEAFFLFSEELDWCIRAELRGWKRVYFSDKTIYHHLGTCRKKAPLCFSEYHFYRSRLLLFRKHFGLAKAVFLAVIYGFFGIWIQMTEISKNLLFQLLNKKRDKHSLKNAAARTKAVYDVIVTGFSVKSIEKNKITDLFKIADN